MTTVQYRGSRAKLDAIIGSLGKILAGRGGHSDIAKGFTSALGFGALSDINIAYKTKMRGGTDEMGIKWKKLAPSTIANRRVGPGDRKNEAIRTRERIRKRETKKALARYRLSLPEGEAQRRAKIVGGLKATKETGKTKVETLGGRNVEILRDTSVMINSLSPGELSNAGEYSKPTGEGADDQIFKASPGEVIVGTNVIYASTHQHGRDSIPARPFLPDDDHPVPAIWWERWNGIATHALAVSLARLIRRTR